MYSIIKSNKIIEFLNNKPTIRENVTIEDCKDVRNKIGQGLFMCKLLCKKSHNTEEAIKLFNESFK